MQICKQSLERCSGRNIRALVFMLDPFGVLRPLFVFLVDAIDLCKAGFAQRALVFPFRPFLDAAKAKTVVTPIDLSKILRFYTAHTDTTFMGFLGLCRRFPVIVHVGLRLWRRLF